MVKQKNLPVWTPEEFLRYVWPIFYIINEKVNAYLANAIGEFGVCHVRLSNKNIYGGSFSSFLYFVTFPSTVSFDIPDLFLDDDKKMMHCFCKMVDRLALNVIPAVTTVGGCQHCKPPAP